MTEQVLRANWRAYSLGLWSLILLWHYILSMNQFSNEVTANLVRIFSICLSIIVYIAILSFGFEKSCCISIDKTNQSKPTIGIWVSGFQYTNYWHNFFLILIQTIPQRFICSFVHQNYFMSTWAQQVQHLINQELLNNLKEAIFKVKSHFRWLASCDLSSQFKQR